MASSQTMLVPILDTKEAAKFLGVSPGTLRRWRCERYGPPYVQQSPRNVRYRVDDLRKWVDDRVTTPHVRAA